MFHCVYKQNRRIWWMSPYSCGLVTFCKVYSVSILRTDCNNAHHSKRAVLFSFSKTSSVLAARNVRRISAELLSGPHRALRLASSLIGSRASMSGFLERPTPRRLSRPFPCRVASSTISSSATIDHARHWIGPESLGFCCLFFQKSNIELTRVRFA